MAEAKAGKAGKAETPREPTQRVILRCQRVLVLPEDISAEQIETLLNAIKPLKLKGGALAVEEAWQPVGIHEGQSKEDAIESHAGKPGSPDALEGKFKAPTVRAWAGGARYAAPPKPLVERESID
jgi:hypothetical protein